MRRGSIIRRLAFGVDDPNASRRTVLFFRGVKFLLRVVIIAAVVYAIIKFRDPMARQDLEDAVMRVWGSVKSFDISDFY